MLSFEELTEARRLLQSFCLLHIPSLLSQKSGISFKLLPSYPRLSTTEARHLTATAKCYSSLLDAPIGFWRGFQSVQNDQAKFARAALARKKSESVSEG